MFPPNAGLICTRSVFSFISSFVQSAVKPVWNLAATLGARDLPTFVAPTNIEDGLFVEIKSAKQLVYLSISKSFNFSLSYTNTLSTPYSNTCDAFSAVLEPINKAYTGWLITLASSIALPIYSNVTG